MQTEKEWINGAKPSPALNGDAGKARRFARQYATDGAWRIGSSEHDKANRWLALYWTRIANLLTGGYPIPGGSV